MKNSKNKNPAVLVFILLAGIVLGGFLGTLSEKIAFLSWLNYGQSFGLKSPLVLDLGILVISFGCTIKITISGILGMIAGAFVYRIL